MGNMGFNLMDGGPNMLDLRFADDILIFAQSRVETGYLLDALVKQLDSVGLLLNPEKTMVITNEPQPPQTITTTAGVNLQVLPRDGGLKWLGNMLTSCGSKLQDVDLQYHLQQASQIFHMNRWILQNKNVSITKRFRHFESVVSSVARFAGGHRTIYNRQLERLDTHFWKLCRSIVGPPPGTAWTLEWHEILHQWNVRVNIFIDRANIKTWSHICCLNYWRLAQHVAMLSQERWVRRILRWGPAGTYRIGRLHFHWESKLQWYCRYKGLGQWTDAAMNQNLWDQLYAKGALVCSANDLAWEGESTLKFHLLYPPRTQDATGQCKLCRVPIGNMVCSAGCEDIRRGWAAVLGDGAHGLAGSPGEVLLHVASHSNGDLECVQLEVVQVHEVLIP